ARVPGAGEGGRLPSRQVRGLARERANLRSRVRLLADLNIAPRTVSFLRSLGHDVQRVGDVLAPSATDHEIVEYARRDGRSVVTQDLDFSAIVALSGQAAPSLISLRLASSGIGRDPALPA